jgi:KDO2-lipid IV(A) lauroyltransferase
VNKADGRAERAADAGYALAWNVVRRVPEPIARAAFAALADLAWLRRGRGVRQLEANLRRVLGSDVQPRRLRAVSRAAMRSYLRYWVEVFRLPVWSAERVLTHFRLDGEEVLLGELARGRGVVAVLPHTGNWDLAGAWIVHRGVPFTTVAERLRPQALFDRFVAYREALGMEVLPLTGGAVPPTGVLARRLLEGGLVCLVGDRDVTASGVQVEFFGEPARMPGGPAVLAARTGAMLLPVTVHYAGRMTVGQVHPPVEPPPGVDHREQVAVMTQAVARCFEAAIAAHPQDWHMLQRVWTADIQSRPAPAASAADAAALAGAAGGG